MSNDPKSSNADIEILTDVVSAIRRSPHIYIGDDPVGTRFVARLVSDLILLDAAPLHVARSGSWYCITAAKDWLMLDDGTISFEPFHRLIPMPSGGRFYDRVEVILAALTDAVVTFGVDGVTWITGREDQHELPEDLGLTLPLQKGRRLAFRFTKLAGSEPVE